MAKFAASNARVRGLLGPFRSGKSSGCVVEIVRRALAQKPGPDGKRRTRWLVVRNTFSQLEDSTIRTFHMWLPPQHFGKYNQTDHNYTITGFKDCEFEVWFRALDRPDHVRNLLSVEVTGAWVNEAREVPWAIMNALEGRIEQYPNKAMGGCTWAGLFMDTNPPDVDSDWYRFFEEQKHPSWYAEIFRQPSGLSPEAENLSNLPNPNYYKILAQGKSAEWVKVYIEGKYGFIVDGKPVYPEYSDTLHLREVEPIPGIPIIRSYDFGLTPACAFSQILPDGRWLTFDEMLSTDMGFDRFSDDVLDHCARSFKGSVTFEDYGDPAGLQRAQTDERTCFEIAASKGINMQPSEQEPLLRMESVRKPLRTIVKGEPMFVLHPRCRNIRKGFLGGYQMRRLQVSGPARFAAKPDKGPLSHIMNALEYGCAAHFGAVVTGSNLVQSEPLFAIRDDPTGGRSPITGY